MPRRAGRVSVKGPGPRTAWTCIPGHPSLPGLGWPGGLGWWSQVSRGPAAPGRRRGAARAGPGVSTAAFPRAGPSGLRPRGSLAHGPPVMTRELSNPARLPPAFTGKDRCGPWPDLLRPGARRTPCPSSQEPGGRTRARPSPAPADCHNLPAPHPPLRCSRQASEQDECLSARRDPGLPLPRDAPALARRTGGAETRTAREPRPAALERVQGSFAPPVALIRRRLPVPSGFGIAPAAVWLARLGPSRSSPQHCRSGRECTALTRGPPLEH
jgi:hypothetical protein